VEVGLGGAPSSGSGGGCGGTSSFAGVFARGGRGGNNPSCATGSNALLNCDCAMPVGSTLFWGAAGTSGQAGSAGGVIIYY
jgi:hypothetical protein